MMQHIEVLFTGDIEGGCEPLLQEGMSVTFRQWTAGYQPRLIDSSIWAYIDWIVSDTVGLEICKGLRADPLTARAHITIMLEKHDPSLTSVAMESGADAYIIGRADRRKIIATVSAATTVVDREPRILTHGSLLIEDENYKARYNGKHIPMWPAEFRLLRHFVANRGRIYTGAQLNEVLGKDDASFNEKTVARMVSRLRAALRHAGAGELIRTVRSSGYIMDE